MSASQFVITLLTAAGTASTLFLVGSGLTLVFGALRIVNIAHGSIYMYAALFTASLAGAGVFGSYWLALPAVLVAAALLGALLERVVMRRLYRVDPLAQLLGTFALFYMFDDLATVIWGRNETTLSTPGLLDGSVTVFGSDFPTYEFFVMGVAAAAGVSLWILLRRTMTGWKIRAALNDRDLLSATGTNVSRLFTIVFVLGTALAALGGAVSAPMQSIGPGTDATILVNAFVVAIIGGMGSIPGAALAALLLGLLQAFGVIYVPSLVPASPYVAMIALLVLRPQGLLGARIA